MGHVLNPAEELSNAIVAIAQDCDPPLTWDDQDQLVRRLLPVVERIVREAKARGYERGRRDFQFAPEGDNHHNAALCPYCSPRARADAAAGGEG